MRDRLLHHAIYRVLYSYFDQKFIFDSYSCRAGKGTHKAMNRFKRFGGVVSKNNTRTAWVLKCDIIKFFANIVHQVLLDILESNINDPDVLWLFAQVIESFNSDGRMGVGLPLGNLTSQLLVNIYMNEFDQFAKRELKIRRYIRYADDFVVLSENREWLENILPKIRTFLFIQLKLELHPDKVFIKTLASSVDFLGWIHFTDHQVLRQSTKRRMLRRVAENPANATYQSYLGLLKHGNTWKVENDLNQIIKELL